MKAARLGRLVLGRTLPRLGGREIAAMAGAIAEIAAVCVAAAKIEANSKEPRAAVSSERGAAGQEDEGAEAEQQRRHRQAERGGAAEQ